jgi:hypothetical protein
MKTKLTINTDETIFLLHYYSFDLDRKDLCNLKHIPTLLSKNNIEKIEEFHNYKFKRISKKVLKEKLIANQINFDNIKHLL